MSHRRASISDDFGQLVRAPAVSHRHASQVLVTRADGLLAFLDPERRAEVAAIADLEELLATHLAKGAAEWPALALEPRIYVRHLADKLRERTGEPADRVIRTMPAADLYLAAGCTSGVPAAIAAFQATLLPVVRPALAKIGLADTIIEETEQRTSIMILVGDPDQPAIARYQGRGTLKSWVRSIAIRTGRRLAGTRDGGGDHDLEQVDLAALNIHDPELALLRERYREQAHAALVAAVAALTERQRNVLRQYYLDNLTIDQLAALYRVDRATTARWVIAARTDVLTGIRTELAAALGANTDEIDSILRLVRSQLELSLRHLG
jgi:RNA polymerase sigma-70 factor (ECF subfamily)